MLDDTGSNAFNLFCSEAMILCFRLHRHCRCTHPGDTMIVEIQVYRQRLRDTAKHRHICAELVPMRLDWHQDSRDRKFDHQAGEHAHESRPSGIALSRNAISIRARPPALVLMGTSWHATGTRRAEPDHGFKPHNTRLV